MTDEIAAPSTAPGPRSAIRARMDDFAASVPSSSTETEPVLEEDSEAQEIASPNSEDVPASEEPSVLATPKTPEEKTENTKRFALETQKRYQAEKKAYEYQVEVQKRDKAIEILQRQVQTLRSQVPMDPRDAALQEYKIRDEADRYLAGLAADPGKHIEALRQADAHEALTTQYLETAEALGKKYGIAPVEILHAQRYLPGESAEAIAKKLTRIRDLEKHEAKAQAPRSVASTGRPVGQGLKRVGPPSRDDILSHLKQLGLA